MENKKWKFRSDMLNHYINSVSDKTFQDAEDRLNYLESKEQLPDMREKVKEYISELDIEIDRYNKIYKDMIAEPMEESVPQKQIKSRINTLTEVKNDLESRLESWYERI